MTLARIMAISICSTLHDTGKGVPSFDEMMDTALVEVPVQGDGDFHDRSQCHGR